MLNKKRVYSEEGNYLGKIEDVILGENKIDGLKIRLDKKHKIKGMIVNFKHVDSVGHIVILNKEVLEKMGSG